MRQVLFWIPDPTGYFAGGIPVFGFGVMLFVTFLICTWLASRRADREGVGRDRIQDLAIWVFVTGIIGARIVYMIQYKQDWTEFLNIWNGGIVFYGSAFGGVAGYVVAWYLIMRKAGIPFWRPADVIAPAVAVGLCLGRVGCFLNGCCYGNVACPGAVPVHFPTLTSPAREWLVQSDQRQTLAGFTVESAPDAPPRVGFVEPDSPAAAAGLKTGDVIVEANGKPVRNYFPELMDFFDTRSWPRGKGWLTLAVRRDGQSEPVTLPTFTPRTVGLHPTQLYESVSMFLLFLLLTAYYPLRRHDGQVFVLLMACYACHRFLNEMLRNDTAPVAFGMTLSQNGSLLILGIAAVLEVYLLRTQKPLRPVPVAKAG